MKTKQSRVSTKLITRTDDEDPTVQTETPTVTVDAASLRISESLSGIFGVSMQQYFFSSSYILKLLKMIPYSQTVEHDTHDAAASFPQYFVCVLRVFTWLCSLVSVRPAMYVPVPELRRRYAESRVLESRICHLVGTPWNLC